MKGYSVQVNKTSTMVVGGRAQEEGRALDGSVSYPSAAIIRNPTGGQTVYLGGQNVTTAGFPLAAGEDIEVDLVGEILFGITSTTSQTLFILRRGD